MTPHSITDDIANACASFMAPHSVEIHVEATYRYDRLGGKPLAGIIDSYATVQGDAFRAPPDELEIETTHPSMHEQRIKWRIVAFGSDSVGFRGLAP